MLHRRHRRHRHAATAAALLATLAVFACSDGGNGGSADGTDGGSAAGASRGLESSSSSSSSPTSSLLPPVVTITPGPDAAPDSSALGSPHASDASPSVPEGPLVESATWADSDYGATLKIAPTEAGRLASDVNAAQTAWREVLALAPDADTQGMWEQFDCHWTWARIIEPNKPTWNVEPWRPVVDESQMLTEGCNPGGPEV